VIVKNLVSTRGERPPLRKYAGKNSMSVLIGIICADAIVLAADSQITDLSTGEFSNVDKLGVVEFLENDQVLIAQGGLWPLTNRIVEKMREKAKGIRITSASTVTKIVEDSIREAKFPLDERQNEFVNQHGSALLIAFYVGETPHLYTVDCYGSGFVNAAEKHYAAIGAGAGVLASYLLSQIAPPVAFHNVAFVTAVFVIGKVKAHQKALCGGDTKIKILFPPVRPGYENGHVVKSATFDQGQINIEEKLLLQQDEKENKPRKMLLMLEEHAEKMNKTLENKGENKS
jgi:20S proteasome alpha/beta subunit